MDTSPTTDLEMPHSAEESRRAALGFVTEAFVEALLAGLEGVCVAQAALTTALQELVVVYGEERVAQWIERMPERLRCGEFSVGTHKH